MPAVSRTDLSWHPKLGHQYSNEGVLANHSLVQPFQDGGGLFAAHRTSGAIAELPNIKLEFGDSAAQGIAVHTQFACGFALVAFVLLKNVHNEALLEFTNRF